MSVYKTLGFLGLVLLLLAILSFSFPEGGVRVGGMTFYFPSVEDLLESKSASSPSVEPLSATIPVAVDTVEAEDDFFFTHPARIELPGNDLTFFDNLFATLDSLKHAQQSLYVLHYGDSQIEGDRISGFLRQRLQERFGGTGPGLLPAVQPIPSSSVAQTASENIEGHVIAGVHKHTLDHADYGVLGQVGTLWGGDGELSIATRSWKTTYDLVKTFTRIRVFVNHAEPGFSMNLEGTSMENATRTIDSTSRQPAVLSWEFRTPLRKVSFNLVGDGSILGIALDGPPGVTVTNIPLRGSSGTYFTSMSASSLRFMMEELNADLILLQFGGNAVPALKNEAGVGNFKKQIAKQINYLKKIRPSATILFIGPADMSTKVNGKLQTYPILPATIDALREAALENGAAFWDMYRAMGGKNSMMAWVDSHPPLAATDYIHFTPLGAQKMAEYFYESLMLYYEHYSMNRNNPEDQ